VCELYTINSWYDSNVGMCTSKLVTWKAARMLALQKRMRQPMGFQGVSHKHALKTRFNRVLFPLAHALHLEIKRMCSVLVAAKEKIPCMIGPRCFTNMHSKCILPTEQPVCICQSINTQDAKQTTWPDKCSIHA
jgi:hypothetical protein